MSHLNAFNWEFTQPPRKDKPEIRYSFIIEFGLHCFTRGLNAHQSEQWKDVPEDIIYSDSRERRIFDFHRYELSKQLPEIIKKIDGKSCFHTGKENFFIIELIDEAGDKKEYEIYFKAARAIKNSLKLFIQSAYVRDKKHRTSQPHKKKISFFVIAYNVQANKEIKIPPK